MHCVSDDSMVCDIIAIDHHCTARKGRALGVGSDAAGHYHANTTLGSLYKVSSELVKAVVGFFKHGVHGAHESAVFELSEP